MPIDLEKNRVERIQTLLAALSELPREHLLESVLPVVEGYFYMIESTRDDLESKGLGAMVDGVDRILDIGNALVVAVDGYLAGTTTRDELDAALTEWNNMPPFRLPESF